jgi:serine protease AprX
MKGIVRAFFCICVLFSLDASHTSAGREGVHFDLGAHHPAGYRRGFPFSKLSPALQADLADGSETTFLVLLADQVDLSHVAELPNKEARGRAVYDALRETAWRTQAPLRAELDALGVEYRPFYIVNMLAVQGHAGLALALAARPDVARLEANPAVQASLPATDPNQGLAPVQAAAVEWGVSNIRADDVWALGYAGEGIVVAGQDTGYDWDHPALKAQYRGWNGTAVIHDYNWHDAIHSGGGICGADSVEPCDDSSHGTHTMGTIVGDDGGSNQIGVAPGARWIGCRNMDGGWGTPATYAECFEFFLAPYPIGGDPMTGGDPSLAPHVINNSWSCPPSEGCDRTSLRAVVENVRAAGIVVVVSAGNSGYSGCGTVDAPPALHDASFSIGATNSSDQIASFSSRGPVTVDGSNRPKPDVSAPGVGVRSSVPGGGYSFKQGTSMAAPHVSGLMALLWSAAPHLIGDVDLAEKFVRETARPVINTSCGGDADGHPNNVYGWGIVDALAAVREGSVGLGASLTAEPQWVQAGQVITYVFAVNNTAVLSQATGVVLSDTLPLSTTFAWASGSYSRTGEEVIWNLGAISPSQRVSATLVVTVESTVLSGTQISNMAYRVRSNEVPTPVTGAPSVVYVYREGDPIQLGVSVDVEPQWVQPGGVLSYTFTVSNVAAFAPATGVVLSDVLPLGTTFAWVSGDHAHNGGEVTWNLDTIGPKQQVSVTLAVTVGITVPSGTSIVNADYGVRSSLVPTLTTGAPAMALVPWRLFLQFILKN